MTKRRKVDLEDIELINQLRICNSDAFDKLINKYENKIRSNAFSLGYKYNLQKADIEDLYQEVLLKLYSHTLYGPYDLNLASISTYFFMTMKYEVLNFIKGKNNTRDIEDIEVSSVETPDVLLEIQDLKDKIRIAYEKLNFTQKEIFRMKYVKQMKYKEISDELNISIDNVKVRLNRTKKQLNENLKIYEITIEDFNEDIFEEIP